MCIRDSIKAADIALCNVETTFGGPPYSGYPAFSSPDELAKDLADAGFDVAFTANNHMHDRGENGIVRTVEVLKENGFVTTGSTVDGVSPRYAMINVKGVDIGVIAYTYETPSLDGGVYLNGVRPVSYTHLDVYKRQVYNTNRGRRQDPTRINQ